MFAKSFDNAQLWVGLVSISAVIPEVLAALWEMLLIALTIKLKASLF